MLLDDLSTLFSTLWSSWAFKGPRGNTFLHCDIDSQGCISCGSREFERLEVISDELALAWELSSQERLWFDQREGHLCRQCHMSRRVRMLLWSLRHEVRQLDGLRVLHLNRINHLSPALCGVASLVETMYVAGVALGDSVDGYSNQDLTHLTFPTGSFDLVIHSETLEHVFEPEIALEEAHRVLKPGGRQIYTVPLLHRRTTRQRAVSGPDGEVQHLLAPSYHGLEGEDLVVWEFGRDFIRQRKRQISTIHYDNLYRNGTVFAIVERKAQEST